MKLKFYFTALFIFLVVCSIGCSNAELIPSSGEAVQDKKLELSEFRTIPGTYFLVASIHSSEYGGIQTIGSRIVESFGTNNLVYLNLETETLNRLLDTDAFVIEKTVGHSSKSFDSNNSLDKQEEGERVDWWVYQIIETDSNQNGILSRGDKFSIGVADVGGQNFTELFDNVDEILAQEMKNDRELLIIFVKEEKQYLAKIDMVQKSTIETKELFILESEFDQ